MIRPLVNYCIKKRYSGVIFHCIVETCDCFYRTWKKRVKGSLV